MFIYIYNKNRTLNFFAYYLSVISSKSNSALVHFNPEIVQATKEAACKCQALFYIVR